MEARMYEFKDDELTKRGGRDPVEKAKDEMEENLVRLSSKIDKIADALHRTDISMGRNLDRISGKGTNVESVSEQVEPLLRFKPRRPTSTRGSRRSKYDDEVIKEYLNSSTKFGLKEEEEKVARDEKEEKD